MHASSYNTRVKGEGERNLPDWFKGLGQCISNTAEITIDIAAVGMVLKITGICGPGDVSSMKMSEPF